MGKRSMRATRKDTFYKRAKDQGYRSRASFKLVHLNNKYGFLKGATVCIDLCAAPGSWMQVAREYMKAGSLIIGVDQYPIKGIPHTMSIKGDITTESLRSELRATLKSCKADVVLHDGAPRMGLSWIQDAYAQNLLVLHAFKLACEFLNYGGHFVTKVFRSKDYFNLEYVFKQLFRTVEATKPQASRFESAEIFVVCQHYRLRQNDKADPKFFDPKEVFKEVEGPDTPKINLQKPEKAHRKAEGYEDDQEILYVETKVSEFITSDQFEELLQKTNALVFDEERWSVHPSTTQEIRYCCQDIKVLGRRELRLLLKWRKQLQVELEVESEVVENKQREAEAAAAVVAQPTPEEEEEDEMARVNEQIKELEAEAYKDDKKKQTRIEKQKRALQLRLRQISEQQGGNAASAGPVGLHSDDVFDIKSMEQIKNEKQLLLQYDAPPEQTDEDEKKPRFFRFRKGEYELDDSGVHYRRVGGDSDSDLDDSDDDMPDVDSGLLFKEKQIKSALKNKKIDGIEVVPKENQKKKHAKAVRFADGKDSDDDSDFSDAENEMDDDLGLAKSLLEDDIGVKMTTDLVGDEVEENRERTAELWFSQDIFNEVGSDDDVDYDVDAAINLYKRLGRHIVGEEEEEKESAQNGETDATVPMEETDETAEQTDAHMGDEPSSMFSENDAVSKRVDETLPEAAKREAMLLSKLKKWFTKHNNKRAPCVVPCDSATDAPALSVDDDIYVHFRRVAVLQQREEREKKKAEQLKLAGIKPGPGSKKELKRHKTDEMVEQEADKKAEEDIIKKQEESEDDSDAEEGGPSLVKRSKVELTPSGLAFASQIIKTSKTRRDAFNDGWNRYMRGDEPGLPDWFKEDEDKHFMPHIEIDPDEERYYTARERTVNVRTLKKVMEAKVRKKRKFKRSMQKVIKKAEAMQGSALLSDYEKHEEIKTLYKKAMKSHKKKETTYIVMTKKNLGRKPKGIKGRTKMVDARLKKDVRGKLRADARKKKFKRRGKK